MYTTRLFSSNTGTLVYHDEQTVRGLVHGGCTAPGARRGEGQHHPGGAGLGKAVHVDTCLESACFQRLKLDCDKLRSSFAYNFKLRR